MNYGSRLKGEQEGKAEQAARLSSGGKTSPVASGQAGTSPGLGDTGSDGVRPSEVAFWGGSRGPGAAPRRARGWAGVRGCGVASCCGHRGGARRWQRAGTSRHPSPLPASLEVKSWRALNELLAKGQVPVTSLRVGPPACPPAPSSACPGWAEPREGLGWGRFQVWCPRGWAELREGLGWSRAFPEIPGLVPSGLGWGRTFPEIPGLVPPGLGFERGWNRAEHPGDAGFGARGHREGLG